jgi:hypothetical protein
VTTEQSQATKYGKEMIEVRFTGLILALLVFCTLLACPAASSRSDSAFAIYVPGDPSSAQALTDLLDDSKHTAIQVSTLREALASNAGLLVLWLADREALAVDEAALNALRKRRVIAVGHGSAELFGRLGLEINYGACMLRPGELGPRFRLEKNSLISKETAQREMVAFMLMPNATRNPDYNYAMYIPAKSHLRSAVEVIGRWSDGRAMNRNYAPIVRQGNYVMIGFAAPVSAWTGQYRNLFRELATSLLKRPTQAFPVVKWDAAKPGVYEFKLARIGSTTDLADRTFYFSFKKPTAFTAKLDTRGSSDVMLLFVGKYREHWTRKDAGLNQQTKVAVQISEEDVQSSGEGHWKLTISNFDAQHEAQCTLTIAY